MKKAVIIPQGQRVVFPINGSGNLVAPFTSLLRAEDTRVNYWQVNIAPTYRAGVGPLIEGMPGFASPALEQEPGMRLRMTWGGGGINFRTELNYPAVGASFVASGDNIQIDVGINTSTSVGGVVFTEATKPVYSGWVKPLAAPTSIAPLIVGWDVGGQPSYGPRFITPWTKALHVAADDPAAVITVRLYSSPVLFSEFVWNAGSQPSYRIPLGGDRTYLAEVLASVGNVNVAEEYAFT